MIQAVAMAALVLAAAPAADLSPAPPALTAPLCGQSTPLDLAKGDFDPGVGELDVTCISDCGASPDVSCTGTVCNAVDRNCPNQRGYVECDGVRTYCPTCKCTNGNIKWVPSGSCCNCYTSAGEENYVYECINGDWVYQYSSCMPSPDCRPCM